MILEPLQISTGETILFFVLAAVMVVLAVYGLLFTRRAVYSVVCVIGIMVGFAILYTMLEAPFMGVVQIAVYTGAILMMLLFVLMMIGVDPSDSTHETKRAQRPLAALGGLGFIIVAAGAVLGAATPEAVGMKMANAATNPKAIAQEIFSSHVLTMELTGALLIVAALGAMTLTHRQVHKRMTQPELAEAKMEAYAISGRHIGQKPPTGVYAESNSAANPALTVGGKVAEGSMQRVLRIRGQERTVEEISPVTAARAARNELTGPGSSAAVHNGGLPGMPGEPAPVYPAQEPDTCDALEGDEPKSELESGEEESK